MPIHSVAAAPSRFIPPPSKGTPATPTVKAKKLGSNADNLMLVVEPAKQEKPAAKVAKAEPPSLPKVEEPRPVVAPQPAAQPPAIDTKRTAPPTGAIKADAPVVTTLSVQTGDAADFVAGWAGLWSEKNVEAYFALYADDFKPSTGQRAKDWIQSRGSIMKRAAKIAVGIDKLTVVDNGDRATVTFKQTYASSRFNSVIIKRLELVKVDGAWKISREVVVPVTKTAG